METNLLHNAASSSGPVEGPEGKAIEEFNGKSEVQSVPPPMTGIPGKKHTSNVPVLQNQDVVIKAQTLPERDTRVVLYTLFGSTYVGFACLLVLTGLLLADKLESRAAWRSLTRANVIFASLCVLAMISCTTWYVVSVICVTRKGYTWSHRQKWDFRMDMVQCISHCINCVFYLAPNAMILLSTDEKVKAAYLVWFLFIRFSMWNNIFFIIMLRARLLNPWVNNKNRPLGDQPDSLLVDAPFKEHWYLAIPWLVYQSMLIMYLVVGMYETESLAFGGMDPGSENILCKDSTAENLGVISIKVGLIIHQVIGFIWCYRGYKKLTKQPYNLYRWTNIKLRYHIQHVRTIGDVIAISFVLMFWVKGDSCGSRVLIYFGLLPAQFMMTMQSAINSIIAAPVVGEKYSEAEIDPNRLKWMESPAAGEKYTLDRIDHAPMFCFETALKTWFWSWGAYRYDTEKMEITGGEGELPQAMNLAMQMYGLTNHEYVIEDDVDTHILIAWNNHTVVVSFRGTASFTNVVADTKIWMTSYPPGQCICLPGTQSAVHAGFAESWTRNNLSERVVSKVINIVSNEDFDKRNSQVIVTGHSLGGALAVLASYDIALKSGLFKQQILCYTFGAPRVGNLAFAAEYDSLVPNTWQVINDNDIVPTIPKFGVLYKHVGRKVIINNVGDLIVHPTAVEVSLEKMVNIFKNSNSIAEHYLDEYRKSFVGIFEAQFVEGKSLKGGADAVLAILKGNPNSLPTVLNVKWTDLIRLQELGSSIWTTDDLPEKWR